MRTATDETNRPATAATAGRWSRARQWVARLLGRAAPPPRRSTSGRASTLDKAELETVRRHLGGVLDQHPRAREVMKYVRALERGLQKKGRFALDDLPIEVIRRALEQLDPLVSDWSLEGLSTLRSKAAVAIASRERAQAERAEARRALKESDVEVEEASVTTFMQANEEWERSFTGGEQAEPSAETADATKRGP